MQNFVEKMEMIASVTSDIDEMNQFLSKNISSAIMECAKSGDLNDMEKLYEAVPDWHHSKATVADMIRGMKEDKIAEVASGHAKESGYCESRVRANLQSLVVDIMALESKAGVPSAMDEEFVKTLVSTLPAEKYIEFIYQMATRFTKCVSESNSVVAASVRSEIIGRIRELMKAAEAAS